MIMVFTLQRYIFREAFKVFVLSAAALTVMMSIGSILRPVQEYGVGPRQVLDLMFYFLPITLTFVLPMAALFAASLVYGRLASDNELDACRASGISLLTLVYPGAALAIMVAIANLLLSFHVMPVFVQRAESALKADAKQILFRNIERRSYYELPPEGRYRIFADFADSDSDTLFGVVVTEIKDNRVRRIISAESASVRIDPHDRFNEVQIRAHNTNQVASEDEGWFFAEYMSLTTEFGSLLGDDIKFKKVDELKRIQADPMRFEPIERLARQAYSQLTAELLAEDIGSRLTEEPSSIYRLYNAEETVWFRGDNCAVGDERQVQLTGKVVATEYDTATKARTRTLRCVRAVLHIEGDELAPTLTLELYSPTWELADGTTGLARRELIRGLVLPQAVTEKFASADVLESVSPDAIAAALRAGPSAELSNLQSKLRLKIDRTLAEISAETHTRLVFGIGCITLILIGIGLGIMLKGGHLLTAFGTSSVPAGALIVCLMMGKNITKNPGAHAGSGIVLMWGALVCLSVLAVAIYRRLMRN
jgi:lipopolysaccharide export LptBFGC system permease protein LptF